MLTLADGSEIGTKAVLIATGIAFRRLEVPGLDRLSGSGVYYYAPMSEAFSYRDGDIYIVGGANSAGQAAMYFSRFARQVTMLVRGESLSDSMSQYLEKQIAATKNIQVKLNSSVTTVEGTAHCEKITIKNNKNHETETVPASALLIYAGAVPRTDWLAGIVERDAQGYIISGQHLMLEGSARPVRRPIVIRFISNPAFREFLLPAMFGIVRPKALPREWEKAPWPLNSFTNISACYEHDSGTNSAGSIRTVVCPHSGRQGELHRLRRDL